MYSPLACNFCSKSSKDKIEKVQYGCPTLITNDSEIDYKFVLNEIGNSTMEIKRLHKLALEIFKTSNNLNPNFIKDNFNLSPYSTHRKHYIFVPSRNIRYIIMKEITELFVDKHGTP